MTKKPKQYFVATACIFNLSNQILLTRRHSPDYLIVHNLWQFPGGSVEYGENPRDAALREVREETGITIQINTDYPLIHSHVFKGDAHIVTFSYPARYVSGSIDISKDKEETSDARWFTLEEIAELTCMPNIKEQAKQLFTNRVRDLE